MHEYQYCTSCRFPIFYFIAEYQKRRLAKFRDISVLPEYIRNNNDYQMRTDDIFDTIGVSNLCCRKEIMTGTRFFDEIYSSHIGMPGNIPRSYADEKKTAEEK